MSNKTVEILQKARALLVKKGWCQRNEVDEKGRHCAIGALKAACKGMGMGAYSGPYHAMRRVTNSDTIWGYNDAQGRTKREVLAAFTKAINAELKSSK